MDWTDAGLKDRIKSWLEGAAADRYVRDKRLDPFATSMRDFDDVSPNLKDIRLAHSPSVNDPTQRIADLRAAGLVAGDGKSLSTLGETTLAAWEKYGVDSNDKGDELARLLLFVLEGRQLGDAGVAGFLNYWSDLRAYFDPLQLIESWDALYVLNYLDLERDGFYPGAAYRDQGVPVADIEFDLVEYANTEALGPAALTGATRVDDAVSGKVPRGRHRSTLGMALEITLSGDASAILAKFGIPRKPRTWSPLNETQKAKVSTIISDYNVAPSGKAGADPIVVPVQPSDAVPKQKPALPNNIDFSKVLVEQPKGKEKGQTAGAAGTGPKKVDHLKKVESDSHVGKLGEEFAIAFERWRLRDYPQLLLQLRHVSESDDTLGYDIESFELDGSPRFVEVKGTLGPLESRFFLSANEVNVANEKGDSYVVLRVANLATAPTCCEVRKPSEVLSLMPATFEARFKP